MTNHLFRIVRVQEKQICQIFFGIGVRDEIQQVLSCEKSKTLLLSHERIVAAHRDWFESLIHVNGVNLVIWPEGEKEKSWDALERLLETMFHMGLRRSDRLIVLGGGVLGDLGGLAAALYMRGISLWQVPTTLLAQVDSALGGKTAVDMKFGKNLVGIIRQPDKVWIDPLFLSSLPKEEWINGMGEIIKYAILIGEDFFGWLEHGCEAILSGKLDVVSHVIQTCVNYKLDRIETDFNDKDERRLLNFGHTVGHALEAMSGYSVPHGRAVLMGLLVESQISLARKRLPEDDFERIQRLIDRIEPYSGLPEGLPKVFWDTLAFDKKRGLKDETYVMALPWNIGNVLVVDDVSREEIRLSWEKQHLRVQRNIGVVS